MNMNININRLINNINNIDNIDNINNSNILYTLSLNNDQLATSEAKKSLKPKTTILMGHAKKNMFFSLLCGNAPVLAQLASRRWSGPPCDANVVRPTKLPTGQRCSERKARSATHSSSTTIHQQVLPTRCWRLAHRYRPPRPKATRRACTHRVGVNGTSTWSLRVSWAPLDDEHARVNALDTSARVAECIVLRQ